jgi:hypothetical protein
MADEESEHWAELERKALDFLYDRNRIQRETRVARSGKETTFEQDVSGGLNALITIISATDRDIPPSVRIALAAAFQEVGGSRLIIRKRLRRGPGRPPKGDVEQAYAIHSSEVRVEKARRALKKKRPIPPAGLNPQPVTKNEAISATNFGRTATYEHQRELAKFRKRKHN